MIISKVIRKNRKHITRADYGDEKPMLSLENVEYPKIGSLQASTLRRLFPAGITISHRSFDCETSSYRLGAFVDGLRDKGWTIVNHDEVQNINGISPRRIKFTRYELFAMCTPELQQKIQSFCLQVDDYETKAASPKKPRT
jgi:hypothetical protein